MAMPEQNKDKQRILRMVRRSGMPVQTASIADRVKLTKETDLTALLAELVTEGRLVRQPTLMVNGEVGYLYDVPSV